MTKDELQHVREALYRCLSHSSEHLHKAKQEALRILDAALAAPEPQPVVWQERQVMSERDDKFKWGAWYPCNYNDKQVAKARLTSTHYEWRPLYTAHKENSK